MVEEYLDILDENGNLTGKSKPRSQIHRDGDWHRAAHVWLVNSKGGVLLQLRSPQKESHPNKWDISVAGHVKSGDSSIVTAIKELKEEIGYDAKSKELVLLGTLKGSSIQNNGMYVNNSFKDIYVLHTDLNLKNIKLQKEEVAEVKFIDYRELKKRVGDNDPSLVPHKSEYEILFDYLEEFFVRKHNS